MILKWTHFHRFSAAECSAGSYSTYAPFWTERDCLTFVNVFGVNFLFVAVGSSRVDAYEKFSL